MSPRILIADDSAAVRSALKTCLELNPGFDVCGEAENGEMAVQLVHQLIPDIVLLDYSMPIMDGLEAARQIAAFAPRTTMFLFTMHASERLYKIAETIGVRAIVSKGVGGIQEIVKLIATLHRDLDAGKRIDSMDEDPR